jgi:hypothetical protein
LYILKLITFFVLSNLIQKQRQIYGMNLRKIFNKKTRYEKDRIRKIAFSLGISTATFERDLSSKTLYKIEYWRTRVYIILFGEKFAELLNEQFNKKYEDKTKNLVGN